MVGVNGRDESGRLDCVVSVEGDKCEETYMIQGECVVPVPKSKRKTCNLTKTQQVMIGVVLGAILGAVAFTAGFLSGEQEENFFDKQLGFSNSTISSIYTSSITPSLTNTSTMLNSVYSSISTTKTNKHNSTDVSSVTKSLISNTTNLNDLYVSHSTENNSKQPSKTSTKNSTEQSKGEVVKGRASLLSKIADKKKAPIVKSKVTLKNKVKATTPGIDTHTETLFRTSCEFGFENTTFIMWSVGDIKSRYAQYVLPDLCKNINDLCELPKGETLALVIGGGDVFYCMDRDGKRVSKIIQKNDEDTCVSKELTHTRGIRGFNKRFKDKIKAVLNSSCSKFRSSIFDKKEKICKVICNNRVEQWKIGFEEAFGDIGASCKSNYTTNGYKVCGVDRLHLTALKSDKQMYITSRDGSKRSKYSFEDYNANSCPCEDVKPKSKFGDYMDVCIDNALEYGCKDVKLFKNDHFVLADKMYKDGVEQDKPINNGPTFIEFVWNQLLGT